VWETHLETIITNYERMDCATSQNTNNSAFVWLLLRHFPKWLAVEDKENLLEYFGASEVKAMPSCGKMVINCS